VALLGTLSGAEIWEAGKELVTFAMHGLEGTIISWSLRLLPCRFHLFVLSMVRIEGTVRIAAFRPRYPSSARRPMKPRKIICSMSFQRMDVTLRYSWACHLQLRHPFQTPSRLAYSRKCAGRGFLPHFQLHLFCFAFNGSGSHCCQ
jgi:hypothetical protein